MQRLYAKLFYSGNPLPSLATMLGVEQSTTNEQKSFSVLICVIAHVGSDRQKKLFERTLESLLALDTTSDVQVSVLVLDNASPIPVQDLVARRASSLIQVVRREDNNIGAARRQAVQAALARHEWIAFVEADIELPSDWLMELVRELQTNAMKDAVGIATVNRPPPEGDFSRALGFLLHFGLLHFVSSENLPSAATSPRPIAKRRVTSLSSGAILLHAKAVDYAGNFDPAFSRVGEDFELCHRLKSNGSLWLLSGPIALRRQDRDWQSWGKRMFREGWGQMDVARKHPELLQTKKVVPLVGGLLLVLGLLLMPWGFTAPLKLLIVVYLGFVLAPIILRGISEGKMEIAFQGCWISLVTHLTYSAGMIAGLLRLKLNPITRPSGGISVSTRDTLR